MPSSTRENIALALCLVALSGFSLGCSGPTQSTSPTDVELSNAGDREALITRVSMLHEEIETGDATLEDRWDDLWPLIEEIRSWNHSQVGTPIGLAADPSLAAIGSEQVAYNISVPRPRLPRLPQQPCLLLPCKPIKFQNGWVCFNTGTAGCDVWGVPICTYVCVRVGGTFTNGTAP